MDTERICGECHGRNLPVSQFCRHCGKPLIGVSTSAGRASHPSPLSAPAGMRPVERAADLYVAVESAWGGTSLIGTEPLGLSLYNGGFTLRSVVLKITGTDAAGRSAVNVEKTIEELPRGVRVTIEVPSYDISEPLRDVRVALVSAEYA